jgi:hypothetical protein
MRGDRYAKRGIAAPILPGKTEQDREDMQSCSNGVRQAPPEASRASHGVTREAVWIQPTPMGDLAIVYLEADDLPAAFAGLASSQEPFDLVSRTGARCSRHQPRGRIPAA